MTLSYRGIRCRGKPDIVVSEVSQIVHRTPGLRRLVPRVCHEKMKARGNVEFYLFVGHVSTENDDDETTVGAFFDKIAKQHWFGTALSEEFQREQIKKMAGQDVRVEEFARRLRYESLVVPDAGDPFAEEEDEDLSLGEVELTQRFDRLLVWMSAHAEGSFATLDSARRALGIEIDTRRVLRALRLLGHCETSRDGSRWSIALSTLVPTGYHCFVLAGGRDAALLQALREQFPTEEMTQPSGAGPAAFRVRTAEPGDLSGIGVHVVPQADRALAAALPQIDGWVAMLEDLPLDPAGFTMRRLDGGRFEDVGAFVGKAGLYQLERTGPHTRAFHLYFSPELGWLRGEWTGLRFLARLREFGKARCTFEAETQRLFVPFDWRWPEIYERALVLSSGQLPTRDDDGRGAWLVYSSVERELLDLLRPRLKLEVDGA